MPSASQLVSDAGAGKRASDTAKTLALVEAGWLVVRIREDGLPRLSIAHPNLLQIAFVVKAGLTDKEQEAAAQPAVQQVVRWVAERALAAKGMVG
jgi:hypothetical protein